MKLIYRIKLLCSKCMYILEQIRTVTDRSMATVQDKWLPVL